MGIDGIGKGGKIGGATGPGGADPSAPTSGAGPAFEVKRSERPATTDQVGAVAGAQVGPLEQLKSGRIDVSTYMDLKIDEATAHLKGMPGPQLDVIRRALREKLETDPAFADLVRGATGQAPPAPDE